ncbi:MAG: hypothetical protein CEE43_14880 [Promethearchaeota archaeon Loki_b32]|nr:MAG: hypothetical protein CEE43_14880 [Candidatus Lokiarchaeota archaeon Loki_b32]
MVKTQFFNYFLSYKCISIKDFEISLFYEILSIKFRYGYLSGGLFTNGEFKVVFLLNETPSTTLEEKIINFIKEVEDKLGEQFHKLHVGYRGYMGGKEMNTILISIFGVEILKLIDTKIEQESTKMLQMQE